MSRLDYITIAIVAACILAIIFLVYKMTDLFKGKEAKEKIESVTDSVEVEDDDVYDYELDETVDSTGTTQSDQNQQTQPATTTPATTTTTNTAGANEKIQDASSSPSETDAEETSTVTTTTKTSSGGKFMVIAGAFKQKASAEAEARKLRNKGYQNASVEIFDRGKYAVVLVDRFDNMADAERLIKKLSQDKVTGYVKIKEGQ